MSMVKVSYLLGLLEQKPVSVPYLSPLGLSNLLYLKVIGTYFGFGRAITNKYSQQNMSILLTGNVDGESELTLRLS